MLELIQVMRFGVGGQAVALFLLHVVVGAFFFLSGYHKLYNKNRHRSMEDTLRTCGIPYVEPMSWFVSGVEFLAGAALMLGAATPLAALGLLCICIVALVTDGPRKVREYSPVDLGDRLDDWFYLSEVQLAVGLIVLLCMGPGPISVDGYIWFWLGQ